ncbi:MAG: lipopolysaccharide biosynthesis protein [Phycisphaerales bacterium]
MHTSTFTLPTKKKITILISQSMVGGAVGILFWILLARFMSMAEFGEFSAARSVVNITVVLASLGMGITGTKLFSQSYIDGDWAFSRGFRKSAPLLILGASLICFLVLVGFHSTIHDKSAVRLESFVAVLALLPLYALVRFFGYTNSAHSAPALSSAIGGLGAGALAVIVLLIFAVVQGYSIGVIGAAGVCGVAMAITLFLHLYLSLKIEPKEIKKGVSLHTIGEWVKCGLPVAGAGLFAIALSRGGLIILGWVQADAEAAARLSSAAKIAILIIGIASGLGNLYVPLFARAVSEKNPAHVKKLLLVWIKTISVPVVVLAGVMIVGGEFFLGLYGEEYIAAYWTLVVYVINYVILSLVYTSRPLYQFLGCSRQVLIIFGCAAVFGLAGMVVLGNMWSDLGIAIATLISMGTAGITIFFLCLRKLKTL